MTVPIKIPIPIFDWFATPIKTSIDSVFGDLNEASRSIDFFKTITNKYFTSLRTKVESIKILGMTEPIKLLDIYTQPKISTTIHSRLYDRTWYDVDGLTETSYKRESNEFKHADKYVDEKHRIVILGGPGSGKTTFLKYLALAYIDKDVFSGSRLKTSLFPLYIPMLEYSAECTQDGTLFDYIAARFKAVTRHKNAHQFLTKVLDKGGAIILLDALDEVPLKVRDRVTKQIKDITDTYPKNKFVISCRTADYPATLETFSEVEIARLTTEAVFAVIKGWFKDNKQNAQKLIASLSHNGAVLSLVETPLLLSLLCIQFGHDLYTPRRKAELYKRCIEAFLREWDAKRGFRRDTAYENLTDDLKERIFADVAGHYFKTDSNTLQLIFPEETLIDLIARSCELFGFTHDDSRNILREIEQHHGILERFSTESYVFGHPSIQEYYTAYYYYENRCELDFIKMNIDNRQAFNIIEFIVGRHNNPSRILEFMMEQSKLEGIKYFPAMEKRAYRLWLLYRCLTTCPTITSELREICYRHILTEQINMSRIYEQAGVFPIASLMNDGVRHIYYYISKKRPTLSNALLPLRFLANEIIRNPSTTYATHAIMHLKSTALNRQQISGLSRVDKIKYFALQFCIIIPTSAVRPNEVRTFLSEIIEHESAPSFRDIARESLNAMGHQQSSEIYCLP